MKSTRHVLALSIFAALGMSTDALQAASVSPPAASLASASVNGPRITATINDARTVTLSRSHPTMVDDSAATPMGDGVSVEHMQLILQPSQARHAAMEAAIAQLHDPKAASFHHWLTPAQFGEQFGVNQSDIAETELWLKSQGFTVNSTYPNLSQIDFSGTVANIRSAFHTQEAVYTINGSTRRINTTDIQIPEAMAAVVSGVMGLSDFHQGHKPTSTHTSPGDNTRAGSAPKQKPAGGLGQTIPTTVLNIPTRALVPNDFVTMYGIRDIRNNGVIGKGVTIAVVEDGDMITPDWTNFVNAFNLKKYGGTWASVNPPAPSGVNNCLDHDVIFGLDPNDPNIDDPNIGEEDPSTVFDSEWVTAIAPGAHVIAASCADNIPDANGNFNPATTNIFGGVFIAADNLINASTGRPNIISGGSYEIGEYFVDAASKQGIDQMWAQADAEGISVFVDSGQSGANPSFGGQPIGDNKGNPTIDANAFASSAHDTSVGATDLADILDGTTNKYFASTPSIVGGSALSYVPEIPYNNSCGNGVAAKANGYGSAIAYCNYLLTVDPDGNYANSQAGSGGFSRVDAKPAWQGLVYGAANDQSRDLPDVSLFGGSFGNSTYVAYCDVQYTCSPDFSSGVNLSQGAPAVFFAGIQALIDQGLADRGGSLNQGNAANTLYALAAQQYGSAGNPSPAISNCSADKGAQGGTSNCVFHNITRGSISSQCYQSTLGTPSVTANCFFYGSASHQIKLGLTTIDASPTSYGPGNKAYAATPGWSFASGLGSVNVKNLLIAWRKFDGLAGATVSNAH